MVSRKSFGFNVRGFLCKPGSTYATKNQSLNFCNSFSQCVGSSENDEAMNDVSDLRKLLSKYLAQITFSKVNVATMWIILLHSQQIQDTPKLSQVAKRSAYRRTSRKILYLSLLARPLVYSSDREEILSALN